VFPGSSGGSGVVIMKYPASYTLPLIGAGLTAKTESTPTGHVIIFTQGTDTVSW
jgi:hypothetical protein